MILRHTSEAGDGDAKAPSIREKILRAQDIDPSRIVLAEQVHGTAVAGVKSLKDRLYPCTDGFITGSPGIALGVFSADCVPVFLSAAGESVAGILHAGRKGTTDGILSRALALFASEWGVLPKDTLIHLGPHIRKCCYEADLSRDLAAQARAHGVPEASLSDDPRCTSCSPGFFSYRRTKTAERMVSFILIQHEQAP